MKYSIARVLRAVAELSDSISIDHVKLAVLFAVGIAEFGLFVGEIDRAALDVGGFDECGGFEDVSVGDDECRVLSRFDGADQVVDAEDLCGSEGDAVECGFL